MAVAGAGGAPLAGPATVVLVAVRATVLVRALVTVPETLLVAAGTTLADVAVAGADVAGAGADVAGAGVDGSGWLWGCDPAGWPGAAGPPLWVTLWMVWLTLARAPGAGDWPGLPPGAPVGACPGGVLAAGPVLEPPDPPGKMSWVTPLTADAAALAAGALVAGVLAAGAGAWFAAPLDPGGAGTLAAGAA